MGVIASQITSLTIVYSIVYSDADQRTHQSSASLAFVRGIYRGPVNSPHKWPVTRKMLPFDDSIMSILEEYDRNIEIDCCQTVYAIMGYVLTHWGRYIMADIYQTPISNEFFNEFIWFSMKISLKCVPMCPINIIQALAQIIAWSRQATSHNLMVNSLTHICVIRPQLVNIKRHSQLITDCVKL